MFLGEEPLGFFISSCFHFFLFSFLLVFISSCFRFFRCFYYWLHLCCYCECYGFEKEFFTFRRFLSYTPFLFLSRLPWSRSYSLEGCRASHWDSKHRPRPYFCLNNTRFSNYMINREFYLNLSKYVDKLLLVKSFINFKHIS